MLVVAAIIPLSLAPQIGLSPAAASAAVSALKVVFCLTLVCLFAAIAVAVLKYRLYDINRVISRTLAYAIVTGVLAGVYAGLVLLATQVFGVHAPVAVAAATLAAAALFSPCGAGCSGGWTGGSTGPGMTPTRPWPHSRPG